MLRYLFSTYTGKQEIIRMREIKVTLTVTIIPSKGKELTRWSVCPRHREIGQWKRWLFNVEFITVNNFKTILLVL